MANDKIDQEIFKALKDKTQEAISKGIKSIDYADTIKNRIVKRTKLGTGVDPDTGASKRITKLKDSTKKKRKRYKSKLDKTTTWGRSNLTATGQLLESVTAMTKKIKDGVILTISVKDERAKPNIDGSKSKIGNKKLVEYLAAQGRIFLGLTKSQRNDIAKDIRQILKKFL